MPEGGASVRIGKALADAGVASRRAADSLVEAGRVTVNGAPAQLGQRVNPRADRITVDGAPVSSEPRERLYLALHKPAGVTSTVSDRHAERTVLELVPPTLRPRGARLYPVGRLDRDSEGLLLLTNDGDWAQRLLHPRYGVEREYAIALEQPLSEAQSMALQGGIRLEEGIARLTSMQRQKTDEAWPVWYRAVIKQGWKRQLRRMFAEVDAPIVRLVRLRMGSLALDGLAGGAVRPLSERERRELAGPVPDGLVVSLDGPGSSGKSTVGAGAALELGYRFCDTGVLYRALTWLAIERGADPDDPDQLTALIRQLELAPDEQGRLRHVRVAGEDVTDRIHSAAVDREVSRVSRHAAVRAALLPIQRSLAAEGRIIMAGRDIGTVVLPEADLKLYIDVALEERARRRALDRGVDPAGPEGAAIREELRRRDGIDSTRAVAPLRIPDGATILHSDDNTLAETVAEVVGAVRAREAVSR